MKIKNNKGGGFTHLAVRKRWHSFSTSDSVCLSLVMYEKSCLNDTHGEDTKAGFPRWYSTDEFSLQTDGRPLLGEGAGGMRLTS